MFHEKLEAILSGPDDFVLDSKYEIEDALLVVKSAEESVEFYKELKKYRVKRIDEQIGLMESKAEKLRKVILNTMVATEPSKKTLNFPGVGKVTRRAGKPSWEIKNEKEMLDFLEEQGVKNQVVETKEVISKKEANKLFDCFVDQNIKVPGVVYVEPNEGVSISFDEEGEAVANASSPKKVVKSASPSLKIAVAEIDELAV